MIVKATPQSEAGDLGEESLYQAMHAYNQELVNAGVMMTADGLQPSSQGARVRFEGAGRTVLNGPFPETPQLVAGFWL